MKQLGNVRRTGKTTFLEDRSLFTIRDKLIALSTAGGCRIQEEIAKTRAKWGNSPFVPLKGSRLCSVDKDQGVRSVIIDPNDGAWLEQCGFTIESINPDKLIQQARKYSDYWGKVDPHTTCIVNFTVFLSDNPRPLGTWYHLRSSYGENFLVDVSIDSTAILINSCFCDGPVIRRPRAWDLSPSIAYEGLTKVPNSFLNWKVMCDDRTVLGCAAQIAREQLRSSLRSIYEAELEDLPNCVTEVNLLSVLADPELREIKGDQEKLDAGFTPGSAESYSGSRIDWIQDMGLDFSESAPSSRLGLAELWGQKFPTKFISSTDPESSQIMVWVDDGSKRLKLLSPKVGLMTRFGEASHDGLGDFATGGAGAAGSKGVDTDVILTARADNYNRTLFTNLQDSNNPLGNEDIDGLTAGSICWDIVRSGESDYIGNMIWAEDRLLDERRIAHPLMFRDRSRGLIYNFYKGGKECVRVENTDDGLSVESVINFDDRLQDVAYLPAGGICDSKRVLYPTEGWF